MAPEGGGVGFLIKVRYLGCALKTGTIITPLVTLFSFKNTLLTNRSYFFPILNFREIPNKNQIVKSVYIK